jgi:hypothetical protein
MGTAFDAITLLPEFIGIIPRAVDQIFSSIVELKQEANTSQNPEPKFTIDVQFIEVSLSPFSSVVFYRHSLSFTMKNLSTCSQMTEAYLSRFMKKPKQVKLLSRMPRKF